MPTYISLCNYTTQAIKGAPGRIDTLKQALADNDCTLKAYYTTLGGYDIVIVIEAPNADVVAKLLLAISSAGNISTTTLRAFNEDETRAIIASLP